MWNDGYSKEQPWLNYFNSYERMHCCFDGDGEGSEGGAGPDDVGATDEAASTSAQGTAGAASSASESEASFDEAMGAQAAEAADSMDPDALSTDTPGLSAAEAAAAAAAADALGAEATQAEQQAAIDTTAVDIAMENNPDLYGYNDLVDLDYFDKRDAAMSASDKEDARSHEADMKSRGYNVSVSVDKTGTYSYTGPDATAAAAASISDAVATAAQYTGVLGMANQALNEFGVTTDPEVGPALSYNEETARSDKDFAESMAEFSAANAERSMAEAAAEAADPIGAAYAMSEAPSVEDYRDALGAYGATLDELSTDNPTIGSQSDRGDLDAMDREDVQDLFGVAPATDVYDYYEDPVLDLTRREEREQASKVQASVAPTPILASPKSNVMEEYFKRVGISPTAPSSFQEHRSYLPPVNVNARDLFSESADDRRKLALGTPRYQESSGPNPSIATFAAANGMTYDEAAKRFAPPSVPAMGGGGLRSLMEYS